MIQRVSRNILCIFIAQSSKNYETSWSYEFYKYACKKDKIMIPLYNSIPLKLLYILRSPFSCKLPTLLQTIGNLPRAVIAQIKPYITTNVALQRDEEKGLFIYAGLWSCRARGERPRWLTRFALSLAKAREPPRRGPLKTPPDTDGHLTMNYAE